MKNKQKSKRVMLLCGFNGTLKEWREQIAQLEKSGNQLKSKCSNKSISVSMFIVYPR